MPKNSRSAEFTDSIRMTAQEGSSEQWAFAKVPPEISKSLLRRGRATATVSFGKAKFQALMEPDGNLGHWFKVPAAELNRSGVKIGQDTTITLEAPETQPDPDLPPHFLKLLKADPNALQSWEQTTVLARIDWVHWIESAKQDTTRLKRARDAIDMLGKGKKRVCCFDPSGFYSKALQAPKKTEQGRA